jgi:hypothetical protein
MNESFNNAKRDANTGGQSHVGQAAQPVIMTPKRGGGKQDESGKDGQAPPA